MDGKELAPRWTKHDYYYKLFDEFVDLLDMQNDQLLEIEETMDSLRELHEYRKQTLTQPPIEFKPVKIAHRHRYRDPIFEKYYVLSI